MMLLYLVIVALVIGVLAVLSHPPVARSTIQPTSSHA